MTTVNYNTCISTSHSHSLYVQQANTILLANWSINKDNCQHTLGSY